MRTPYLQDPDFTLWHGDCLEVLRELPSASVHMVATSPPFYGLRDYGVDGQIGLEETPDEWVARLVAVFRECGRVLRDDGTLWIECGDSYASKPGGTQGENGQRASRTFTAESMGGVPDGCKPKDLLGQPWMLAFALRADGWYLRSEIIWARPNPMPESVTDRPTKAHSTVFLLSKRPRYFYDNDAIREPFNQASADRAAQGYDKAFASQFNGHPTDKRHVEGKRIAAIGGVPPPQTETLDGLDGESPRGPDGRRQTAVKGGENSEQHRDGERWPNPAGANARTVWTIPTEPTPFAHFATWPQALIRRMIQAGTSEHGCCAECGAAWARKTERTPMVIDRSERTHPMGQTRSSGTVLQHPASKTIGWESSCSCGADPVPCVVLDPFMGSGTTALVARALGRRSVGIELNRDYCELAAARMSQQSLLA